MIILMHDRDDNSLGPVISHLYCRRISHYRSFRHFRAAVTTMNFQAKMKLRIGEDINLRPFHIIIIGIIFDYTLYVQCFN